MAKCQEHRLGDLRSRICDLAFWLLERRIMNKAPLPIMNAGGYGTALSNIFSSSIQARRDAANNLNSSTGYSGSGGSAPSNNSVWVTPSGAVVTFGGQLLVPPPQTGSSISGKK
jgi:hypothetical protein